jgi:phage shock protein A
VHASFDQHRRIGYAPANEEEEEVAGLFERMSLVIKAKLSKLLDRAEDPSETLDYSYEQQLQLLQNVKRGIADVVTSKKRLQLQADKLEQSLVKLDTQARDAVAAGREDLARQALERKTLAQQQLQDLDRQVEQLEGQQEKLATSEKQLSAKIEAFRSQKEVIKAQYSAAEAQVRIGEAATGIGEQMADTGLAIQRAKDKTEQMQARAGAVEELIEAGTLEDFTAGDQSQLDRELAQISAGQQVDAELERLKAEVGAGAGKKELEQ